METSRMKKFERLKIMSKGEKFPREFKIFLRNFVVDYIIEEPPNVIDFGVQYFSKDVEMRRLTPLKEEDEILGNGMKLRQLSAASVKSIRAISNKGHRQGVVAEVYSPEEFEFEEDEHKSHKKTDAQRDHLIETVKHVFAFRILDHNILQTIIDHMVHHKVKKGEYLMQEGFNAEKFYVIERGTFKEIQSSTNRKGKNHDKKDYKLMTDNGHFGQLALHYHHTIPNTVLSDSDGLVWSIDRQVFRRLVLKHAYAKVKQFSEICNEIVLLKELTEDAKMDLYDALIQLEIVSQTVLFEVGDEPNGMYFIEFGNVRTYILDKKEQETDVRYYTKGEYFGEVEILRKKNRTCTAVTVGNIKAAFLPVECFDRVLGDSRGKMEEKLTEYEQRVEYLHGVPELVKEAGLIKN